MYERRDGDRSYFADTLMKSERGIILYMMDMGEVAFCSSLKYEPIL